MTAIIKREFNSYFHSFIGWLFIGAVLFLSGIYISVFNLYTGYPNMAYPLQSILFLFLIGLPILSMRVLAEERRQKTDQLILTAPVTVGQIVAGKFLAIAAVFSIPMLVLAVYPLILTFFGTVQLGESYVALLGFFLYGLCCLAICEWVSSLTESQVISAVVSFAVLFLGYIMSGLCNLISPTGNLLTKLLGTFDLYTRFSSFMDGSLDLRACLYFLTLLLFFLFLTVQSIQKRRYCVAAGRLRPGAYSGISIAIAVAAAVLINLAAGELPVRFTNIDVTSGRLYSLSEESVNLAEKLAEDVTIYVLANKDNQDTTVQKTLERYAELSSHIELSYVDPTVNPRFYTQYTTSPVSMNSLIISGQKRSKVIDYQSLYETEMDYSTYSSQVTGYDAEGQITSALAYVTSDDMPKIYILSGHDELPLETDFNNALAKENVDYETINLMQYDAVPADAEGIIINAPTTDYSADDAKKVIDYLSSGGDALIISTWTDQEMTNFQSILDFYGVSVYDGLILEGDPQAYYQNPFGLLPTVEYDEITQSAYESDSYVFAPYAQGLITPEEDKDGISYTPLLTTSEDAYIREDVENMSDFSKQEGDQAGPFTLGVRAVKTVGEQESTAVIFSCENLFTDSANTLVSGTNLKLFSGVMGSLVNHAESVSIPVKSYEMTPLTVPQETFVLLSLTIVVLIPFGLWAAGFVIWFRRRKR